MNSVDLKISNVRVTQADGEIKCKEIIYMTEIEVVHFLFEKNLSIGDAALSMDFEGELNDKMKGFYRSKYLSYPDLQERFSAVTQFEATDARYNNFYLYTINYTSHTHICVHLFLFLYYK